MLRIAKLILLFKKPKDIPTPGDQFWVTTPDNDQMVTDDGKKFVFSSD